MIYEEIQRLHRIQTRLHGQLLHRQRDLMFGCGGSESWRKDSGIALDILAIDSVIAAASRAEGMVGIEAELEVCRKALADLLWTLERLVPDGPDGALDEMIYGRTVRQVVTEAVDALSSAMLAR